MLTFLFPPSLGIAKASARAEMLEQSLTTKIGVPFEVRIAKDYADLERRALALEAALVWVPGAVCARLEPVARHVYKAVRRGESTYRSVLVSRASRRLTLDTLRGLRAAWLDPQSVGGCLLAKDLLFRRGLDPETMFSSQIYVGSHPEVLAAVMSGNADVGAVIAWADDEEGVRQALSLHAGPIQKDLAVLAVTDPAPNDAVMLTSKLSAADADRLAERLFPANPAARVPSYLLVAMGADGFERTTVQEYRPLLRLMRAQRAA